MGKQLAQSGMSKKWFTSVIEFLYLRKPFQVYTANESGIKTQFCFFKCWKNDEYFLDQALSELGSKCF